MELGISLQLYSTSNEIQYVNKKMLRLVFFLWNPDSYREEQKRVRKPLVKITLCSQYNRAQAEIKSTRTDEKQ